MANPADDVIDILLVEDNPNDAEFALRALRKSETAPRVLHVEDGAAALDFILRTGAWTARDPRSGPKVVLLDLKLPKVDGLEVLRRVKSDERGRSIPIVILTSSKEPRDLVESYRQGVNSYVVKPVDFAHYTKALAQLAHYWTQINQSPVSYL